MQGQYTQIASIPYLCTDENGIDCDCVDMDECGVCNGLGAPTWYQDEDGDGIGNDSTIEVNCVEPMSYVQLSGDCDDTCYCTENDCTAGGSCIDQCGLWNCDSYTANCSDPTYVNDNYPGTMKCDNMDCSGNCDGTHSFQQYYVDYDGDEKEDERTDS